MSASLAVWVLCTATLSLPALAQSTGGQVSSSNRARPPSLPSRDLTVEFRQVEEGREGQAAGTRYGAGPDTPPSLEPQLLQVRNGERASLRLMDAVPMQWTQSIQAPQPGAAPGSQAGVGMTQGLHWFDAGQTLTVQPRWPGGQQDVVLELEVTQASVGERSGNALPVQGRSSVNTTVTVPLAEWVTVAASGRAAPRQGSYSSDSALRGRRLLQVRVMAP